MEQILNIIFNTSHWEKNAVTCFTGSIYPYQFISKCLKSLIAEKYISIPRSRIQLNNQDAKSILPQLQQTILGQSSFFWLGDIDENFPTKQSTLLIETLSKYNGDNRIALFAKEVPAKTLIATLPLPNEITLDDCIVLIKSFYPKMLNNEPKLLAIEQLFRQNKTLPLNLLFNILDSLELVHSKNLGALLDYLTPSLPFNAELSQLSQAFFKRDPSFFKTWQQLTNEYPPVFWLAFWGDQWWRAFHVVTFALQKNIVLAKKMGFKLPYSFITKEWQTYQPGYFQHLLAQLYTIDYNVKQGSSFCFFDLVYAQHFAPTRK